MNAAWARRAQRMRRARLEWGAAAIALSAIACGPAAVTTLVHDYHAEVRAALGETGPPPASTDLDRFYPPLRERRLAVGDERVGVLDFAALQRCRLGTLVARRNSALGRLMRAPQRLVHEVEVLLAGDDCLVTLEGKRRERLLEILGRKRAVLGRHVWNAVWTDSELDGYLSWERPPAPDAWDDYAIDALVDLGRVVGSVTPVEDDTALASARSVESALAALHRAAPGGGLLRALADVAGHMDAVAALLERHAVVACQDPKRGAIEALLVRHRGLEGELAHLDRRGRDLVESLNLVYRETASPVEPPPAMQRYAREHLDLRSETALWPRYRRARQRHAQARERLLRACAGAPPA